jgi:hypothetical protein
LYWGTNPLQPFFFLWKEKIPTPLTLPLQECKPKSETFHTYRATFVIFGYQPIKVKQRRQARVVFVQGEVEFPLESAMEVV